jgi:hypothetical protein
MVYTSEAALVLGYTIISTVLCTSIRHSYRHASNRAPLLVAMF